MPDFYLIIDPKNNVSEGTDATAAWENYLDEHNAYVLSDCRVLECTERQVKAKLEFL
jgi:hypothetical protein